MAHLEASGPRIDKRAQAPSGTTKFIQFHRCHVQTNIFFHIIYIYIKWDKGMLLSPCTVDTSNNLDTFWLHWFICNSFSYTNLGNGSTLAPRLHAPQVFSQVEATKGGCLHKNAGTWMTFRIQSCQTLMGLESKKHPFNIETQHFHIVYCQTLSEPPTEQLINQLEPWIGRIFWQAVSTAWSAECLYPAVEVFDLKSSHHLFWANY